MQPLKLGFIGGGIDSAVGHAHYSACRMDGLFEVVHGCFSRNADINQKTAEKYNCDMLPDWHDVIHACIRDRTDAVVILTPTPYHFGMVEYAMKHNVPVICEKALATTSAEAERLCQLRGEADTPLFVTYNYTGYPMVRVMADIIEYREIGQIISIQAEMPQEGYLRFDANPQAWRREDGEIPAVHLDLGTHLHHLICFLTGQFLPQALTAMQQSRGNFGVVDDVRCLARYDGFDASLWFGKTSLGHRNGLRIRVNCTEGSAEWYQANPEELQIARDNGTREVVDRASPIADPCVDNPFGQRFKAGHPAGFLEAYANLYQDFYNALMIPKGITLYSPEVARDGLVMMERMVKAAKERVWI